MLVVTKNRMARVLVPPILLAFSEDLSAKIRVRVRSKVSATRRSLVPAILVSVMRTIYEIEIKSMSNLYTNREADEFAS